MISLMAINDQGGRISCRNRGRIVVGTFLRVMEGQMKFSVISTDNSDDSDNSNDES